MAQIQRILDETTVSSSVRVITSRRKMSQAISNKPLIKTKGRMAFNKTTNM